MLQKIRGYLKSTFVRYMVSYVLIVITLIVCLTIYMYAYYRKTISHNIEESEINKLASVRYLNEKYLNALSGMETLIRENDPQSAQEWSVLLARAEAGSDFFERVYIVEGEKAHTAHGDTALYELANAMEYENADRQEFLKAISARREDMFACQNLKNHIDDTERKYVTVFLPLNIGSGASAVFLVPESSFHPMLDDEIDVSHSRYILRGGEVMVAGDDAILADKYAEMAVREVENTETGIRRAAGRDYLCILMPGNKMDITYLSVIPTGSISAEAASGWMGFVAILLVFAVPCLVIMVLISRLNYRHIREISERFRAEPTSDADEIHAIREGISRLDRQLMQSEPARRIQFVQNLVRGRFGTPDEAEEAAQAVNVCVRYPYFAVLLLGTPRNGGMDVYLQKILDNAPKEISVTGTDLLANEQILLVAFAQEVQTLFAFAESLCMQEWVKASRVPVSVSNVHTVFSEMPVAYLEANSAYENRFVMGEARLLKFRDISYAGRNVVPQAEGHIEAVKRAISSGDMTLVNEQLDELLLFLRNADMSLFAFRQIYNDVISSVMSLLPDKEAAVGLDSCDLFTLSGCRSIDELDGILRKVCTSVAGTRQNGEKVPLIQSILAFMTQNYTDSELTIAAVAEKFDMATARLSLEFKNNMHMTPYDYLTMLRMEHVKRLLRQTDRSIKDVCNDVGYSDVSSFIRRFKQYTGLTPLQYRQSTEDNAGTGETEEGQK